LNYSHDYLCQIWFRIYQEVEKENQALGENRVSDEQLVPIATTIFITAGQRGYLKVPPPSRFEQELLNLTKKAQDRTLQKSIYESVRALVNGNGIRKEVV